MTSKHYITDRIERENNIKIIGAGKPVARFVVDRGHKNGPEIHEITSTAIINIYNQRTHKLVTKLVARPGQIKRYFKDTTSEIVKDLMKKAKYNSYTLGYNY